MSDQRETAAPRRIYFGEEAADDDGEIVSIPAGSDLDECKRRGRADYARGVQPIDCPYVCGYPVYAWEEGWEAAKSEDRTRA